MVSLRKVVGGISSETVFSILTTSNQPNFMTSLNHLLFCLYIFIYMQTISEYKKLSIMFNKNVKEPFYLLQAYLQILSTCALVGLRNVLTSSEYDYMSDQA